jgi:DinB family protein
MVPLQLAESKGSSWLPTEQKRRTPRLIGAGVDARLHETVHAFAAFMLALPPSSVRPQSWGPREVLAHITFWHERYVRIIDGQLTGHAPPALEGVFYALNARAVQSMADESVAAMARRLITAQALIERLAPAARRRRLRIAIKTGAMSRTVDDLLTRVEAHIRGHHTDLRRRLRKELRH